jgi:uncharacterized protein YpiB (UPF0302 family)
MSRRLVYVADNNEARLALATEIRDEAHAVLPGRLARQIDVAIQMHDRERLRQLVRHAGPLGLKLEQLLER